MDIREIYKDTGISESVYEYCESVLETLKERFEKIDRIAEYNQLKVLGSMRMFSAVRMPSSGLR